MRSTIGTRKVLLIGVCLLLLLIRPSDSVGEKRLHIIFILADDLTPPALKGLNRNVVPVCWRCNKDAWVIKDVFTDWYIGYFCPTVLRFCEENKLPPKAFLLLDNASGHPQNLDEIRTPLDSKVVYTLPNMISPLQPTDQRVTVTFKAYYLRNTFMEVMRALDSSGKTAKDYWRSYDILKGINNIRSTWDEVSAKCLNGVWHKLLPAFIHDFEEVIHRNNSIEELTRLARDVRLEDVRAEDVTEFLQEDLEELYKELDCEQSENEENEEETSRVMKMADLKCILSTMQSLTDELCELDNDWERSVNVKRSIIASIRLYSKILNERKQTNN